VSQEGSDEVGDCRLLVLEMKIEECKLANSSISGKRESQYMTGGRSEAAFLDGEGS